MSELISDILLKTPIWLMLCELILKENPNFKRIYISAVLLVIIYTLVGFHNIYLAIKNISLVIVLIFLAIVLQKVKK